MQKQISRRSLLAAGAATALTVLGKQSYAGDVRKTRARPNILWIVSEDNNPFIGAYGDIAISETTRRIGYTLSTVRFSGRWPLTRRGKRLIGQGASAQCKRAFLLKSPPKSCTTCRPIRTNSSISALSPSTPRGSRPCAVCSMLT